jgi:hypothetical protein
MTWIQELEFLYIDSSMFMTLYVSDESLEELRHCMFTARREREYFLSMFLHFSSNQSPSRTSQHFVIQVFRELV